MQGTEKVTEIDATGYRCPLPVIRVEAALRRMTKGDQLIVRADDPLAAVDIPHFCNESSHLVKRLPDEGTLQQPVCVFLVTCGANPA